MLPPMPGWRDFANCADTDSEVFFPDQGGSTAEAKRICSRCVVEYDCLSYALSADERFGVWGGQSERARRSLKRGVDKPTP